MSRAARVGDADRDDADRDDAGRDDTALGPALPGDLVVETEGSVDPLGDNETDPDGAAEAEAVDATGTRVAPSTTTADVGSPEHANTPTTNAATVTMTITMRASSRSMTIRPMTPPTIRAAAAT